MLEAPDIIYFGGSFDPPHQVHLDCVKIVLKQFCEAKIMVAPLNSPPTSSNYRKQLHLSFDLRFDLCKRLFAEFDSVEVTDLEKDLESPNYTVQTVNRLKQDYPGKRLGVLIGADQFLSFIHWMRFSEILRNADLLVIGRGGVPHFEEGIKHITDALGVEYQLIPGKGAQFSELNCGVHHLSGVTSPASSTEIRNRLNGNKPIPEDWLMESVRVTLENKQLFKKD